MTKQEFMAFSLPYDIKMVNVNYLPEQEVIRSVFAVYKNNRIKIDGVCLHIDITGFKPILRQLSDLTKEIDYKGEKFVPIVELAKMALNQNVNPLRFHRDDDGYYVELNNNVVFAYCYNQYCFGLYKYNELFTVTKQLQLFQKLIEWHFDIAGLIEKGEAIDVNKLETNPYK